MSDIYIHTYIFFSPTEADLKVNVKATGREVDALHAETPAEHTHSHTEAVSVCDSSSPGG